MTKTNQKNLIRKKLIEERLKMDKNLLSSLSLSICEQLEESTQYQKASNILFYLPIKNEVDVTPLLEKHLRTKNILLPKLDANDYIEVKKISTLSDIENGKYDIPEPKESCENFPPEKIELILIPGVAFDLNGNRVGYGMGCYDGLIPKTSCPKIALAYNFQILENVPGEEHDQRVNIIITEKKTHHII